MWDLYETQPIKLLHPAEVEIPVAAVSPVRRGVVWWSANYLIAQGLNDGMPGGSGFPLNPVEGLPEWSESDQGWRITNQDGSYLFLKADEKMAEEWEKYKAYVPSIGVLHRDAIDRYGERK